MARWSALLLLVLAAPAWAQVTIDPPAVDFQIVKVGQSETIAVSVINSGDSAVTIDWVLLQGGDAIFFSFDNPGPFTIAAGSSATVHVTFTPRDPGTFDATLVVRPDGMVQMLVPLHGLGDGPKLSAAPAALDFGNVPLGVLSDPQTIQLKNLGISSLAISAIESSDPTFIVGLTDVKHSLMPDESTTFTVRFQSMVVEWPLWGVVDVRGDGGQLLSEVDVSGSAFPPEPDLSGRVFPRDAGTSSLPGNEAGCACSLSSRTRAPCGCAVLLLLLAIAASRRRS
jgi:hypothetical protein